ncbi:unnamed protein product, partial [Brenthis ino]
MADRQLSWGCCNADINEDDYIQCSKCCNVYHYGCLGINSNTRIQKNWNCLKCSKSKKCNNDETPIRSSTNNRSNTNVNDSNVTKRSYKRQALSSPTSPSSSTTITLDQVRSIVNEVFEKEMSSLLDNINKTITSTVSSYLKSIDSKIEDLQHSISFMSAQYDDMKKQIDTYSDIINKQKQDNESLQSTVASLTNKVNLMEQQARSNNIEIQCVPNQKMKI